MKNINKKIKFRKIVLILEIKNLREITNYLLDNFKNEKINLEIHNGNAKK